MSLLAMVTRQYTFVKLMPPPPKNELYYQVVYACNPSTRVADAEDYEFEASLSYIVRRCLKKIYYTYILHEVLSVQ
jgi:hypothetical protein